MLVRTFVVVQCSLAGWPAPLLAHAMFDIAHCS
jgi:hypothetical protein